MVAKTLRIAVIETNALAVIDFQHKLVASLAVSDCCAAYVQLLATRVSIEQSGRRGLAFPPQSDLITTVLLGRHVLTFRHGLTWSPWSDLIATVWPSYSGLILSPPPDQVAKIWFGRHHIVWSLSPDQYALCPPPPYSTFIFIDIPFCIHIAILSVKLHLVY